MADVGYVHAHLDVAVPQLAVGEGVVEVLGVGGVDGEGEHIAEVAPAGHFFLRRAAYLLGFVFGSLGEFEREVVLG